MPRFVVVMLIVSVLFGVSNSPAANLDDQLDGFAAGAKKMQEIRLSDCTQLVDASFRSWKKGPPSDKNSAWKRGFEDGQSLVFHLRQARELKGCYVPVSTAPLP